MADFFGFETRSLTNSFFRVDILSKAGPRIVRLVPNDCKNNLMAELPDLKMPSPYGDCLPLGGHRLWSGPERFDVTYAPDHLQADLEEIENGFIIRHEDYYPAASYLRQLELTIDPAAPRLKLMHLIKNLGDKPMKSIPWAITQFKLGSRVLIPFSKEPADPDGLLANRNLVMWPYTRLAEKRLHLSDTHILVDGTPDEHPLKVGTYCPLGWEAIEFPEEGYVLTKHVPVLPAEAHGDMTSNFHCYVKDTFIELETLGRSTVLQPGESVSHNETWELTKGSFASLGML
jgi:hypothetical protein